jgi:hypothetical protein
MDKKERDRLIRLYHEKDNEFESAKLKRSIITILVFSLVYFVILFIRSDIADITDLVALVFVSLVFGGIHFWVNATIFSQLSIKGREEREILESIERRIRELED